MQVFTRPNFVRGLIPLALILSVLLAACGSSTNSGGVGKGVNVTVGGKLDTEAQLLTKMFVLVLRHNGYNVTEKAALGADKIVDAAIKSGAIDIYPEFTAQGLANLSIDSTGNPTQDLTAIRSGYESKYQITWLDTAPMNDTYGICTKKATAQSLNLTKISDLAAVASTKTVATPTDGVDYGLKPLQTTYGFSFKSYSVVDENVSFSAVQNGQADFNVCYTTKGLIAGDNFVLLQDDKNAFPAYNPAPIVRDDLLSKSPAIKDLLNPLMPKLTTPVITDLNKQVDVDGKSVTEVATTFLKAQGLL